MAFAPTEEETDDVKFLGIIPKNEILVLRLYKAFKKNCKDEELLGYIQSRYLDLNGIDRGDWRVLEHRGAKDPRNRHAI